MKQVNIVGKIKPHLALKRLRKRPVLVIIMIIKSPTFKLMNTWNVTRQMHNILL